MKHFFSLCLTGLLLATGAAHAQTKLPAAPDASLKGEALKTWLRENWYDGKRQVLGYNLARGRMYNYVDNYDNKLTCVYSGYQLSFKLDSTGTSTGVAPINCEHTVPQSWFNEVERMKSDIHHLFPTYDQWNSDRGSDPFADIPDDKTTKWIRGTQGTSAKPTANIEEYSEDTGSQFEPREDHKGNLARAVFYFYTMHAGQSFDSGKGVITAVADLETLYKWHLQDPVDKHETERNRRAAKAQGNFNPYIAYPELVARAWGFTASPSVSFAAATGTIDEGNSGTKTYTVNVSLDMAPTTTQTVEVAVAGAQSSATATEDYTFSTQTLTFSPTVTSVPVTITVLGDATAEASETVQLQLRSLSAGLASGTNLTHTLTITNDDGDVPTLSFQVATGSATEGNDGTSVYTIEVILSGAAPATDIQVPLLVDAAGTTAGSEDYTLEKTTLTFTNAPVPQRQTVGVIVRGDLTPEASETLLLRLGTPTGGNAVLGTPSTHALTIVNDDLTPAGTPCASLYFSQYIESSGGNTKVLEIYNPSANAVDLAGHRVELFANGDKTPLYSFSLTGTLAAHDVYVIANGGSDAAVLTQADNTTAQVTFFNGNDAIALFSGTDTLDVIGQPGQDPGATVGWAVAGGTTLNNTLVRLPTVTMGSVRWNEAAAATWQAVGTNSFTGVGSYTSTACTTTSTRPATALGGLELYPNPASESVLVRLPQGAAGATISLFNTVGQRVCTQLASSSVTTIRTAGLPAGLYSVQVQAGPVRYTGRVVVRH
ncbi:T9SS type A sorting domain-containing protein [Hymenobacter sp. BT18]|uniref:endonuclease n=1 Tax=Hymenobacter sp. BT18 TaxID=2835648 RepID=UPI00143E8555|nr:endonuclease [Hymenobacter sp. BT18]QIX62848.1 T9SS type A sorting domain-containing protein [Hymenobacter sp. BT18]